MSDRVVRHHVGGGQVVEMRADENSGGRNLDTALLSQHLQEAYAEKMLEQIQGRGIIDQGVLDAAWYRVAERAKELRA